MDYRLLVIECLKDCGNLLGFFLRIDGVNRSLDYEG